MRGQRGNLGSGAIEVAGQADKAGANASGKPGALHEFIQENALSVASLDV